jgi:hypothetical protein
MLVMFDGPEVLQDTKHNHIDTLEDMCSMCQIAEDKDLVCTGILEEVVGII